MQIDAEQALYKELATIKEFKKEVRSLKIRLGKLTGRVDQFELVGFQDQLNRLNERLTSFSDEFTEVKRMVFKHYLTLAEGIAMRVVHDTGHLPPLPPTWQQAQQACKSEMHGYYLQATERMKHCKDIKDMEDALEGFVNNINRVLDHHGFPSQLKRLTK